MDIREYKDKVIELFKSGQANDSQWEEMASAVLNASESDISNTEMIDASVAPGEFDSE